MYRASPIAPPARPPGHVNIILLSLMLSYYNNDNDIGRPTPPGVLSRRTFSGNQEFPKTPPFLSRRTFLPTFLFFYLQTFLQTFIFYLFFFVETNSSKGRSQETFGFLKK